jgi:hypothetical protein
VLAPLLPFSLCWRACASEIVVRERNDEACPQSERQAARALAGRSSAVSENAKDGVIDSDQSGY